MINVTHYRDYWRTWLCLILYCGEFGIHQESLRAIQSRVLSHVTHLLHYDHGCFLIQHLIDGNHIAHLHQSLNDFGSLDRHFLRQRSNRDCFRHHHLMHHRLGWR